MTDKPKAKKQKSYFTDKELQCQYTKKDGMNKDFVKLLNKIREEAGFPFIITSAYRDPMHPIERRKHGGAGAHSTGKAVDVLCKGEDALKLISVAMNNGITRIGVQQKGSNRFIHIDACTADDFPDKENFPEVAIWSY